MKIGTSPHIPAPVAIKFPSNYKVGDIVTFRWIGQIHEGLFLRFEERGLVKVKCAIVATDKGDVAVRPELIVV